MNATQRLMTTTLGLAAWMSVLGQQPRTQEPAPPAPAPDAWRVQAGWVRQWGRGMTLRNVAPSFGIGAPLPRTGAPGMTYPDNQAIRPRTFDDGYVRPDFWTNDRGLLSGPNPERYALTWNWGAENASQYDYDGGRHPTLEFHIDRGTYSDPVSAVTGPDRSDEDLPSDGMEVRASRLLRSWRGDAGTLDLNITLGMACFNDAEESLDQSMERRVHRSRETYTYLDFYGVRTAPGGPWPPLDVPYAGNYGSDSSAGPLIPVRPESSRRTSSLVGTYRDSVELVGELSRMRAAMGPDFALPVTERLRLTLAPQLALEFVEMSISRHETVTFTDTRTGATRAVGLGVNHEYENQIVPGLLLTAGADLRLVGPWFAGATLGWEWLVDDPSVPMGENRVRFDLDGGECSLFLGRTF